MTDTLTGDQTTATRGAMAGATPGTAPAAPSGQEATPPAANAAPPVPRKGGRGRPGSAASPLSTAGATGHPDPATEATPEATVGARVVGWLLLAVAAIGMPLVGVIGFSASYSTLQRFAAGHGFSDTLAPWFPIGIDASIVALLALDLVMVRRGSPWPVLRFAAHAMTLATVVFNAADGLKTGPGKSIWTELWADPLRALSHGVMPVLFVLGVEAARRLLMHAARIEEGTDTDRIPLHRWALAPVATGRLYRRMRLAAVHSYDEMVEREQALAGYTVWLKQKYNGDLGRASEIERLPMTMAPRGYTVEDALALPAKWEADAAERVRKEAERQRAEAERQRQQAKAARIAALTDEADVVEAEHLVAARTGTAAAQASAATAQAEAEAAAAWTRAELQRTAAERQARQEADAMESAEAAADRRKAAEDDRKAAEATLKAAQARDEATRLAAEAQRQQDAAQRIADRRTDEQQRQVLAEQETAAAQLRTVQLREQAARLEAAAEAAEDYARLSQRQRNARRVARILLAAYPDGTPAGQIDPESVPLATIQERLAIGRTVASELRTEAMTLIAEGYQAQAAAEAIYEPQG
ncbi:DUF2637 domain-containing protein [Streptomyces sp. NBC_00304]|uniref:DUF2637 domain-containing protein n=1 Tax=Streptomyces sp. NBC_00304 TaxID=2975706 RepID=UPI002E2C43AB|nr:DUF2637 domain-containing protein [Streptomyces sp. NBC_00304]